MNRLWQLWVTASLIYLLLGHLGGYGTARWVLAKGVEWCVDTGNELVAWDDPRPRDIVITPCNVSGDCRKP